MKSYSRSRDIIGFMAKIDGIEYQINKDGDVRDALKLHEAFYENEYLAGKAREEELVEKRKIGWYQLRGLGYQFNHKTDKTHLYTRAKSLDVIAECVVLVGRNKWDRRQLIGLELHTPEGKKIKLPTFKKVREPDFYKQLGIKDKQHSTSSVFSVYSRCPNLADRRRISDAYDKWYNKRIKSVRRVINRSLKDDISKKSNTENKKAA